MVHFIIVGLLTVASTWYLVTFVFTPENLLPAPASAQAIPIDRLFVIQWFFMAFFLSLIVVFIVYSAVVFRKKKGDTSAGKHFEGNTPLEIAWTLLPLLIVFYAAYEGGVTLEEVERQELEPLVVNVIASQWKWRFEYPEEGIVSEELILLDGKQAVLNLQSTDVIHSFWVPEFRVKQDVLPGGDAFAKQLRITPNQIGDFTIRCAELCGTLHYSMVAEVEVMSKNEYNLWVTEAGECTKSDVECGQELASTYACTACHSIDGSAVVGPTWLDLYGNSVTLADGSTVTADEEYLVESIIKPNVKIHEGFAPDVMIQTFGDDLTEQQITQIVEYIKSLSE